MPISRLLQHLSESRRKIKSKKANELIRGRNRSRRSRQIEVLEARHMLASAIWHNVLQPLNVSGEPQGNVSPIDALIVINELNIPKFSDRNVLFPDVPAGQQNPFYDVNCDSFVTSITQNIDTHIFFQNF